jgi:Eukaryotic initiation factor 4E
MDTESIPTQNHPLIGKWDLYYHLPHDKNWDLNSYKTIMKDIDIVEKVVALNESIPESIVKYSMLFIMRKGITPQWEDPKNRNGGAFSFKVVNKQVHEVWKIMFAALCGESLFIENEINKSVTGITVSPKKNFCILKIWLDNCEYKDPNMLITIPNLQKHGCIFKKHEPEF